MTRKWTQTAAFEHFGTVRKNPRWSWSAKSPDGKTVAVTLWQDEFENGGQTYRSRGNLAGTSRAGRTELMENLQWALDHCGGLVRVVMAKAKDVNADPRSIELCFPHPKLVMKVVELDKASGHFVLERVD
jgi:hypothetical protein